MTFHEEYDEAGGQGQRSNQKMRVKVKLRVEGDWRQARLSAIPQNINPH